MRRVRIDLLLCLIDDTIILICDIMATGSSALWSSRPHTFDFPHILALNILFTHPSGGVSGVLSSSCIDLYIAGNQSLYFSRIPCRYTQQQQQQQQQ
jgi:hypothetical protein